MRTEIGAGEERLRPMSAPEGRQLTPTTRLSVVVPAYNEQDVLEEFHRRLASVLVTIGCLTEIVYVNDGSRDATLSVMRSLSAGASAVKVVNLSRNFGKEIALTAGLDEALGDAVVIIDADLQDPPELIPELLNWWLAGFDNVYARRSKRDGESWIKKATAHAFYRIMQRIGRVKLPEDTGDFRLVSRRYLNALLSLREHHRFMKGLFAWVGYPSKAVLYERDARFAGETKWNLWALWNFAIEGVTSFSVAPLRIASYLGLLVASGAICYAFLIIYKTLVYGEPVIGYPSLMVTILFLGAIQLVGIGIIGEYLGRVFNETKNRPLYVVESARFNDEVQGVASASPQEEGLCPVAQEHIAGHAQWLSASSTPHETNQKN